MKVDLVKDSDRDLIQAMWKYCFQDPDDFVEWFFRRKYHPMNTVGVWEEENIISSLQMIPYSMVIRDVKVPASYIAGVATLPEARNKGYTHLLIRKSLEMMKDRGIVAAPLYPFQYSFYKKYGWEVCYDQLLFKLRSDDLPSGNKYKNVVIKPIDWANDTSYLSETYHSFLKSYSGYIQRDEQDWLKKGEEHQLDGGYGYLALEAGIPLGYILYHLESKHMHIDEMIYVSHKAFDIWMSFLRSHASQVDDLSWVSPSEQVYLDLPDSRGKLGLDPFAMMRIVDIHQFFRLLPVPEQATGGVIIKITDEYAPWNQGIFKLSAREGRLEIQSTDEAWEIECSIGSLTQILCGYLSMDQVIKREKAVCRFPHMISFFDLCFPKQHTAIYEMY